MTQVFGDNYASVYDLMYRDKDYDGEVDLLERVFRQYATQPVTRILDLGCGTGNHALRLAARGYEVVGVDRSADMLVRAGQKAREQARTIRFHHADIRDADVGETFDAALMMFAVMSYQIGDADVLAALRTARHHLGSGGLLLSDFWYGPAVQAQGTEERVRTIEDGNSLWVRSAIGKLEPLRHQCHVDFHLRHMRDGRVIEETTEHHTVRYFFLPEINQFLNDTGFRLRHIAAFPSMHREPDHTTWNVMAVALGA
jgi:SAM-dependent methyltransferase